MNTDRLRILVVDDDKVDRMAFYATSARVRLPGMAVSRAASLNERVIW